MCFLGTIAFFIEEKAQLPNGKNSLNVVYEIAYQCTSDWFSWDERVKLAKLTSLYNMGKLQHFNSNVRLLDFDCFHFLFGGRSDYFDCCFI